MNVNVIPKGEKKNPMCMSLNGRRTKGGRRMNASVCGEKNEKDLIQRWEKNQGKVKVVRGREGENIWGSYIQGS